MAGRIHDNNLKHPKVQVFHQEIYRCSSETLGLLTQFQRHSRKSVLETPSERQKTPLHTSSRLPLKTRIREFQKGKELPGVVKTSHDTVFLKDKKKKPIKEKFP